VRGTAGVPTGTEDTGAFEAVVVGLPTVPAAFAWERAKICAGVIIDDGIIGLAPPGENVVAGLGVEDTGYLFATRTS
jgi:hypothetical protein